MAHHDESGTPLQGHYHRPPEPIEGYSTVAEIEEKLASLQGVQLTADSYGTGRVPSIQDQPFHGVAVDYLELISRIPKPRG